MDPVAQIRKKSLADSTILSRAILDSFRKLNPRTMVKNPVMFVVEVGAVLTTIQLAWNASHHAGQFSFGLQITLWLWFTVLFANFAEAMAEGRGKAQADTLRKSRAETQANSFLETVRSSKVWPRSTNPQSPASRRRSSANPAEIVRQLPEALAFCRTRSRSASLRIRGKLSSIA
jgi:high-affinity K+ transport system ATPase subunit B